LYNCDYPQKYECRWCGNSTSLDWYVFGKHSGLGCLHSNRCAPLSKLLEIHHGPPQTATN
jgi:hypothetical protein